MMLFGGLSAALWLSVWVSCLGFRWLRGPVVSDWLSVIASQPNGLPVILHPCRVWGMPTPHTNISQPTTLLTMINVGTNHRDTLHKFTQNLCQWINRHRKNYSFFFKYGFIIDMIFAKYVSSDVASVIFIRCHVTCWLPWTIYNPVSRHLEWQPRRKRHSIL